MVSFEIEGAHVASFEISLDSHDLTLPEFVSVEVYLSGYTTGDRWSIARFPLREDQPGGLYAFLGHFVRDAGSCALAIRLMSDLEEDPFFRSQDDSLRIPALRGQRMTMVPSTARATASAFPPCAGRRWRSVSTAPESFPKAEGLCRRSLRPGWSHSP